MKKSLFLIVSILSIFFITDNVNALTFDVNGVSTEVTEQNLIYYIFSEKKELFDSYDYYYLLDDGSGLSYKIYFTDFPHFTNLTSMGRYGCNGASTTNTCIYAYNTIYNSSKDFEWSRTTTTEITKTSNFVVSNYGTAHVIFSNYEGITYNNNYEYSVVTKQELAKYFDIKNKYTITYYINDEVYKTLEIEEGTSHELISYDYNNNTHIFSGWQYDENIDLTNITSNIEIKATLEEKEVIPVYIDFPITKTEFYALLVEVGLLIMMLFLKWCFPFKGGSDLR